LNSLVALDCFHPSSPSAARLWVRPGAVVLQDSGTSEHPGCHLDVNVGHLGPEKERTLLVTGVDEFGDLCLELLCVFDLLLEFLGLEERVEGRDNVAVYMVSP